MTGSKPVTEALKQLDAVEEGDLAKAVVELWDEECGVTRVYRYVQVSEHYPYCRWVKDFDVGA